MMVVRFLLVIVIVRCVSYMQRMELMQIGCRGNILTTIMKIAKPLIKLPFRGLQGRNGGSPKCRCIREMC